MTKIIDIDTCEECPYIASRFKRENIELNPDKTVWEFYCENISRIAIIIDLNSIPDWCPLKDKEEKDGKGLSTVS